ncbi:MAG: Bacillopeptidase F [Candidatus Marinimicrobia bacterium]|nr:Bacillopeptidase F [Candidatus Neomarinimicrobiota bacterium]
MKLRAIIGYIVWTDDTYAGDDQSFLKYSLDNGVTWSERMRISQDEGSSAWAKVVGRTTTNSDLLYLVWNSFITGIGTEVYGRRAVSTLGETGTVAGTVNAESGDPIADATITANNSTATTDANGEYSLEMLEGTYDIICTAPGYYTETVDQVSVTQDDTTTVDFTLAPQVGGLYPPFHFTGKQTGMDSVSLSWLSPIGFNPVLLSHDDGSHDHRKIRAGFFELALSN